jgi:pSer/pThr/pTyr-binding forkhead associated (FHA) protein
MQPNSEEYAVLVAQTGPLNGQRWPLRDNLVFGRDQSCDIVVADRQVSRHHARVAITNKGVTLEDLGSKNGTHHNGEAIANPVYLQDGDVIQIALAQKFVYLSSDATLPLEGDDIDFTTLQSSQQKPQREDQLRIEKKSHRVWIGKEEVLPPLSVSQYRLLENLYDNQGKVVPRKELIAKVWSEEQAIDVSEQALDALVRRLRYRLNNIDPSHNYVVTIRGHGLRLENPK